LRIFAKVLKCGKIPEQLPNSNFGGQINRRFGTQQTCADVDVGPSISDLEGQVRKGANVPTTINLPPIDLS
jgi:hypothetical protein